MLYLSPERNAELRQLIARRDPTMLALESALRASVQTLDDPDTPSNQIDRLPMLVDRLCLAWLHQDAAGAEVGRVELLDEVSGPPSSDLGKAGRAISLVLAHEFGRGFWTPQGKAEVIGAIEDCARSFLEVTRGNPHDVTNNWWMLTHGGCLLCCLAADGQEGPNGLVDLSELKAWSLNRFRRFCHHFGNAGLYHEGTGYIAYTLSMLMPVAVALRNVAGIDLCEEFPQLARSIPSMLVATAAIRHLSDSDGSWIQGASLQWNDTGRGSPPLNPLIPGLLMAPKEWHAGLRTIIDRLIGLESGAGLVCPYRGLSLAVALYPFSAGKADPEDIIPKWVMDQRQGLGFWRQRWGSGRETVIGWYARATQIGGHVQDDAASIRLISHGRTWICGGGQARAKAIWQSTLTHANPEDRPKPTPNAHIFSSELDAAGGVVAMDARRSLQCYSERYLAWRAEASESPVFAVLDVFDEHQNPPRSWLWNLSFPRDLQSQVHPDGAGFSLLDPQCGTLTARFVLDRPDTLTVETMPGSSRTYANGHTIDYPGDKYLSARFDGRRGGTILVAFTITAPGGATPGSIMLDGQSLRFDEWVWDRPFRHALLSSVRLGQSRPNFMAHPAG